MTQSPAARLVDSHTGGEPTRVLVSGGPDLGHGTMAERLATMRRLHDRWRRALMHEPRGNEVLVGALLCEPQDRSHACGVIFFNHSGYLGMCGHGTIGLVATLAYLGRLEAGSLRIETPVGVVGATLHGDGTVTVANVPAYRHLQGVVVDLPGGLRVRGDVAWGGNWFFLCKDHGQRLLPGNVGALTAFAAAVREALERQGIRGAGGAQIDHVELLGPAEGPGRDPARSGRNFVLCPGGAYDRSPCGTGTSAKLACLAADGELAPGEVWVQESVIGSVFEASFQPGEGGAVHPFIRGRAHVTLDASVVFDDADPFAWGLG